MREIETRTDLQEELLAKAKQTEQANTMPKTTPREETAHIGPLKANVRWDIRAHSSLDQTRKAREGTTLLTFSDSVTAPKFER